MGKAGSRVYFEDKRVECEPFLNSHTIETTGAGDTFMACALNWVLENGIDHVDSQKAYEMLKFANAAASMITTKKGALRVMPEKEEVWNFIQQRNE